MAFLAFSFLVFCSWRRIIRRRRALNKAYAEWAESYAERLLSLPGPQREALLTELKAHHAELYGYVRPILDLTQSASDV